MPVILIIQAIDGASQVEYKDKRPIVDAVVEKNICNPLVNNLPFKLARSTSACLYEEKTKKYPT